jgi:SAM-dependent methyltransferase
MTAGFSAEAIARFWNAHPCGSDFVHSDDWKTFFREYDAFKYRTEPHILDEIAASDVRGKRLLEIGIGQAAEAQRLIEAGAIYNGVDLTPESVERARLRFRLFGLPHESVQVMNAERLDFPDAAFDVVFSHGVIHHSPRIEAIVSEIHRVLKPGGQAIVMVYHRRSVNYQLSIRVIRRGGIFLLYLPGMVSVVARLTGEKPERLRRHLDGLRAAGLSYLRMDHFIHKATDGPDNVYSSVWDETAARSLFARFRDLRFSRHLLNERHLPVVRALLSPAAKRRLAARYGWHLWIRATK